MPRVLIVDHVHPLMLKLLEACRVEVDYRPGLSSEELEKLVPHYDAIVVRSRTKVTRRILEAGRRGRLRVVARAGVGVDNIDVEAAKRLGIEVVNAPSAATQSVAELTIGLMIAAARRLVEVNTALRHGAWRKEMGMELAGKTLLVVGFGRIGRRVAEIAKAIGMRVLAYDIADVREAAERIGVELVDNLCEGLSRADVVTLHVPLTRDTYHMISRETLKCFKKGAILINTSRGAVVDTEAVLEALEEGILSAVALDVLEHEPPETEAEKKLINHPRVVATPHIGAQTLEAQERVARETVRNLLEALGVECRA